MRRFATVAALTAVAAVGVVGSSPAAWAKGPTAATVEGPGLAKPMDIDLGMHGEAAPEYAEFMDVTGVFSLGARDLCRLAKPPTGDLGDRYRLTWRLPSLTEYFAGDATVMRGPIEQDFYPNADGGPLSQLAGSSVWIRGMADTESWWRRLRSELSDPVAGRTDRVSVRGPRLAGGTAIDRSRADQDAAVRLFSASGIPHALFYGGLSPCREAAAPPGDLGPRYTVTWRMGSDEWGVQDVYPYAEGGPVIHDAAVAFNPAARGGWFRPGHELPAVWAKLGLPSEAVARSVAAPAGAGAGSPGAPAGPESIAVAATRPVADGGPGDASPWLFGIGAVAVLATGGWLGIRWRRHGQPVSYRDDPPGNAG